MFKTLMRALAVTVILGAVAGHIPGAGAQNQTQNSRSEPNLLVDKARVAVLNMTAAKEWATMRARIKRAKAVFILPNVIKAGFVLGGEGGNGVLLTRTASGDWSYPAFYTFGAASVGFQGGVQLSERMLLIMTDKGLRAILDTPMKFGGAVSVAVAHKGGGFSSSTTLALGADILSYSISQGLFGGASLEGAYAHPRRDLNSAYYGRSAEPKEIVLQRMFANKDADGLREALAAP